MTTGSRLTGFPVRKSILLSLSLFLLFSLSCHQEPAKTKFKNEVTAKKTTLKGTVHNWPTDTVYFATFTFHSPYSSVEGFQLLTPGKTFEFSFDRADQPFVVFLTPERKFLDLRNDVLFENLTDKYFRGYCQKFYDSPITTYLVEPGTETLVDLTKTTRYGETQVRFLNTNKSNSEFYQTTFVLDQGLDEALDSRIDTSLKSLKNIDVAIKKLNKKSKELLSSLNEEKPYISPFLYKYTQAEIEFGAKKEFLRYFLLDHKDETAVMFKNNIPEKISQVVEFNKNIDYATMISQEYNEFVELYITFKFSKLKKTLVTYKDFDSEKFDFALNELPAASRYSYLANNLLHLHQDVNARELVARLIALYPKGNLNDQLMKKFH